MTLIGARLAIFNTMPDDRFEFANALRGPAAMAVIISHYFHNAWTRREMVSILANVDMPSESAVHTPSYIDFVNGLHAFDWGSYGVALFFLVSGFVIPLSLRKYSVPSFIVGRVFRIWPTYLAGFSISVVSVYVAGLYFGKTFPYTVTQVLIHSVPGLRDMFGVPYIDGIIWTLEVEVKFYVLCAITAPLIRRGNIFTFVAPAAIAILCFYLASFINSGANGNRLWALAYSFALAGRSIVFMFIGTAIFFCMTGFVTKIVATLITFGLATIFLCLATWGPALGFDGLQASYVAAVATFVVFARFWRRTGPVIRFFSNISYPLYTCHAVLGYAIIATMLHVGFGPFVALVVATLVATTLAAAIHYFVEAPTHRLGQAISKQMNSSAKQLKGSMAR